MTEQLPIDPDLEADTTTTGDAKPVHLRGSFLALVALGGACGTAAREGLALAVPNVGLLPLAIFLINITGAFVLGVLLDALSRRGPDHGRRRTLRLLFGTGFLGGYTTYSALATDSAHLIITGHPGQGIGYALATLLIGAAASWAGIAVAATQHRRTAGASA